MDRDYNGSRMLPLPDVARRALVAGVTVVLRCAAVAYLPTHARMIIDVNETNFETEVLVASHQLPVLVDFWADWCPPCRVLTPVLERIVRADAGTLRLAKIEADENMRLAGRFQLRGFPTVLLFVAGVEVDRFSGARSEAWVRDFVAARLNPPAADRLASRP